MIMDHRKKKAAFIIGDDRMYDLVTMYDCDVYYYPINITEWELADELEHLIEYYDELICPIYWPSHLRKDKIESFIKSDRREFSFKSIN